MSRGTAPNMEEIQLETIQQFVEDILNCHPCQATKLGDGATSSAWHVSCGSDQFVFRAQKSTTNRPITYRSEFNILNQLYGQGLPVPEPICNSFTVTSELNESISAWALTRSVVGKPILKNPMTATVAIQLGEFLNSLHQLPCSNFGRIEEQSETLRGQQNTPVEGILARWCWAQLCPLDGTILAQHPVKNIASQLLTRLLVIEPQILNATTASDHVIIHSDLYGEHIFTADVTLSGVIDFGAACIASAGWEFAVLAYHHGWDVVGQVLVGYTASQSQRDDLLNQAHYLAIVIGLYKLAKEIGTKNRATRLQQIVRFLSETLFYT